jgi:hypothetical protein
MAWWLRRTRRHKAVLGLCVGWCGMEDGWCGEVIDSWLLVWLSDLGVRVR